MTQVYRTPTVQMPPGGLSPKTGALKGLQRLLRRGPGGRGTGCLHLGRECSTCQRGMGSVVRNPLGDRAVLQSPEGQPLDRGPPVPRLSPDGTALHAGSADLPGRGAGQSARARSGGISERDVQGGVRLTPSARADVRWFLIIAMKPLPQARVASRRASRKVLWCFLWRKEK